MTARQPSHALSPAPRRLPRLWLFTDERMAGDPVVAARRLPPRSGIVVRHYATSAAARTRLFRALRRIAQARGHVLLLAGSTNDAARCGAAGAHVSARHCRRSACAPVSMAVHNARERAIAKRAGVRVVFISPVFATRSHADARPLGAAGFARLAAAGDASAIALGGMTAARFRRLRRHGAHGWAGIDALSAAPADTGRTVRT